MIGRQWLLERPGTRQILCLLLLSLLAAATGCNRLELRAVPAQMVGEWRTDQPRYQGRFIRLESNRVTFGLAGLAPDKAEMVEKIIATPKDNPTDYNVQLKAQDGTDDSIILQFAPENGGELRLKNQPRMVWTRKIEPVKIPEPPKSAPKKDRKQPSHVADSQAELLELAPASDRVYPDHVTIYKIDCIRPNVCRSH
jgi:hypothetical protein